MFASSRDRLSRYLDIPHLLKIPPNPPLGVFHIIHGLLILYIGGRWLQQGVGSSSEDEKNDKQCSLTGSLIVAAIFESIQFIALGSIEFVNTNLHKTDKKGQALWPWGLVSGYIVVVCIVLLGMRCWRRRRK